MLSSTMGDTCCGATVERVGKRKHYCHNEVGEEMPCVPDLLLIRSGVMSFTFFFDLVISYDSHMTEYHVT